MTIPLVKIGDICDLNPKLPKSHQLTDADEVSFVPMAAVSELSCAVEILSTKLFAEVRKGYTPFRNNDVLFAKITPCMENGKTAIARDLVGGYGFGSTEFHVLRAKDGVLPEWLHFFVRQASFRNEAKRNFTGTGGQQRVPTTFVANTLIPLPPLPEQRRIVDLLTRAEGIVRLRREAATKAAELIPAIFIDMFGDPRANPRGWPVEPIANLGRVQLGRQRTPKYQSGRFTRPYVRVANVHEDRIDVSDLLSMDFDEKDFITYRLGYCDILLNEGQSTELVGRPAMWRNEVPDCCFQNTLVRFQSDLTRVVPEFMLALLLDQYRTGALSRISSKTSNIAHLGAARFSKLPSIAPPLDLQRQFKKQAEAAESIKVLQLEALAKAQATFNALLAQAFSPATSATSTQA
jgi:type I restriction enzyme S subunit